MNFDSPYTIGHVLDLLSELAHFQLLSMLSVLRICVLWRWEAHSLGI
jgi:hypothetical protein